MIVSLIILGALLGLGAICYAHHKLSGQSAKPDEPEQAPTPEEAADSECCGMHITCERDSLLSAVSDKVEYFDDEELDAYAGRDADAYTADETEQFRDVLLTLRPDDIAPWARSVQLRGITLPAEVRDELLMIVAEERQRRATANS